MSELLNLLGDDGNLLYSPSPHEASLTDLFEAFVQNAPFREARQEIYRALEFYSELVWRRFPHARLWINGGFTTHKPWAAPNDADVVVLVPEHEFDIDEFSDIAPFLTIQRVTVGSPSFTAERIQPMGGLIDGFVVVDNPANQFIWGDTWSRVKGPDGNLIPDGRKGYVEVKNHEL